MVKRWVPGNNRGGKGRTGDYEVGYGKPPQHSRFQPGQSGNPAGRPKGLQNLKTNVKRALETTVRVSESGRMRNRSTQETALKVLTNKALRGDVRALAFLIELASRHNNEPAEAGSAQPLSADDQAILDDFRSECMASSTRPKMPDDPAPTKRQDGPGKNKKI